LNKIFFSLQKVTKDKKNRYFEKKGAKAKKLFTNSQFFFII